MHGPQSDRWRDAALLEYNTLAENGTWNIVDLPEGQKAIGSGWVFKVKNNQDGSIEHFKGLVAKGYSLCPGLDYNESIAPTFRPATLCIIMALAAVEDLELCSVMKQPEGFHPPRFIDCASPCIDSSSLHGNRTRNCTLS